MFVLFSKHQFVESHTSRGRYFALTAIRNLYLMSAHQNYLQCFEEVAHQMLSQKKLLIKTANSMLETIVTKIMQRRE